MNKHYKKVDHSNTWEMSLHWLYVNYRTIFLHLFLIPYQWYLTYCIYHRLTPWQCCTVDKKPLIFSSSLELLQWFPCILGRYGLTSFGEKRRDNVCEYACKVSLSSRQPCMLRGKEGVFHAKKNPKTLKYKTRKMMLLFWRLGYMYY